MRDIIKSTYTPLRLIMPLIPIDQPDDPRIRHYANLKDRELAAEGDRFIAEGRHLVERLLASRYPAESVLVTQRRLDQIQPIVPEDVPLYLVTEDVVNAIIGYKFHHGVLAVGRRLPCSDLASPLAALRDENRPITLIICPHTRNCENLGSIFRIATGFGVDAIILGGQCADPFWRRTLRVSMGAVFTLPIVQCDDVNETLCLLKEQHRVHCVAAVIDEDAVSLRDARRPTSPGRLAILLGSEDQGLERQWVDACDERITIPMQMGTDSLNVAIAAAVFLFHYSNCD